MCTMAINNEKNGIELVFESKPARAILESIKAAGFRWHNQKKLWYAKQTEERMALAKKLSGDTVPVALAVPQVGSGPVSKYGIKVGDILECTWGYSMTLVEFYKVTKIISACKVEIVELKADTVPGSEDSGGGRRLVPTDETYGDPIVKMVTQSSYERQSGAWHITINDSVHLKPWDGRPCYFNDYD